MGMKTLSALLAFSLAFFSASPGAAAAFTQVVRSAPATAPMVQLSPLGLGAPISPTLSPLTGPLSAAALSVPALTPAPMLAPVAVLSASGITARFKDGGPVAAAAPIQARTALGALSSGVRSIGRSQDSGRAAALESLFTGAKVRGSIGDAVEAAGAETSGRSSLAAPLTPEALEAVAGDTKKPLAERQAAVAAIAKLGGETAPASLGRVADANPEGGPEDYEVHRAALKALADGFGTVRSLRPVSRAHADAILVKLAEQKPALAVFDFDDTLEPWKAKATPETGAALKAASDAGVRVAILTNRPAEKDGNGPTILNSLETLAPAQKAAVTVAGRAGAEMVQYDAQGRPALVERLAAWTPAERAILDAVSKALGERFGTAENQGQTGGDTEYSYFRNLPIGITQATLDAAIAFLGQELAQSGLPGLHVTGRFAQRPDLPPYVQISKIDKQRGMDTLATQRSAYERLADLRALGLPARAAAKALSWLKKIPEARIPAARTLVVGDQFFGGRSADAEMAKAAPGALVVSVGGKADPRLENIFVWPSRAHAGSMELLGAMARKSDGGFNKKAVVGLFLGRSLSIASFILTGIAYPFIAGPAVGWATFGTLMALGPLAAIATGPLNGALADKFSARTSMTLNMAIRAILALALPAFSYFGILNFWTLLLASIANGWALSASMTTEGAYVRRLAGKHQNSVQALVSINFVVLQVLLGLLIGVGSLIDSWNPVTPFLISAAVHAFIIVPLMFLTMPADKPAPAAQGAPRTLDRTLAAAKGFVRRYWKEMLLTAAAVASYPFIHSALPIAVAFFTWVLRSGTVKALRAGDYREVSPREKEVAAELQGREGQDDAETRALRSEAKAWKGRQFKTILFSAGQAVMTYPFQNFALPLIAVILVGAAGKGLILGQFLGAMYFGNLIANSSQAKLPDLRLPLLGRLPGQRIVQGGVLAMAAAWLYTGLVPGSLLAAAAAVAAAAAMMWFAGKVTHRGWIRMLGLGLAALTLPASVWFFPGLLPFLNVKTAMMLAMLAYGFFVGPSAVSLGIYQQNNTDKKHLGKVFGSGSSFFNTFNSLGYGLLSLAAGAFSPAFPALFVPLGLAYLLGGWLFHRAPARLPGLPESSFKKAADRD